MNKTKILIFMLGSELICDHEIWGIKDINQTVLVKQSS